MDIIVNGPISLPFYRHSFICHNLATVAIENVDLLHPQSIEIAHRVIQASPAAPDEDACLKVCD